MSNEPEITPVLRRNPDDRREQLMDATVVTIAEYGLSNVTLSKVAQRAGLTAGMVNFHFESKQDLLCATLERIAEAFVAASLSAVEAKGQTTADRLLALAEAPFVSVASTPDNFAVWYAYWGEFMTRSDYVDICLEADRVFCDLAEDLFARLAGEQGVVIEADAATYGLRGMIDTLSVDIALGRIDHSGAKRMCRNYLRNLFPSAYCEIAPYAAMPARSDDNYGHDAANRENLNLSAMRDWAHVDMPVAR